MAVDQYIIVASIMNTIRQSTSKNMNEHSVSNIDMYTMLSIQIGCSVRACAQLSVCSLASYLEKFFSESCLPYKINLVSHVTHIRQMMSEK